MIAAPHRGTGFQKKVFTKTWLNPSQKLIDHY